MATDVAAGTAGTFGQTCASCGALLEAGAYWCGECGQSLIALAAAKGIVSAAPGRAARGLPSIGLSYSGMAGIAAAAATGILVIATVGGGFWATGPGTSAGGSPTPNSLAAAGESQSFYVQTPTSQAAASASLQSSAPPLGSSARPASATPPASPRGSVPAATAAPTSAETTPTPAALAVEITRLPASIAVNSTATVIAVTTPGATCQIKVKYHSGKSSLAPGLLKKQVADATGKVSWTWTVEAGTKAGTATATVTCKLHGKSADKSKVFVTV